MRMSVFGSTTAASPYRREQDRAALVRTQATEFWQRLTLSSILVLSAFLNLFQLTRE